MLIAAWAFVFAIDVESVVNMLISSIKLLLAIASLPITGPEGGIVFLKRGLGAGLLLRVGGVTAFGSSGSMSVKLEMPRDTGVGRIWSAPVVRPVAGNWEMLSFKRDGVGV